MARLWWHIYEVLIYDSHDPTRPIRRANPRWPIASGPVESVLYPALLRPPMCTKHETVLTPPSPTFYPLSEIDIFTHMDVLIAHTSSHAACDYH
jgi:hypothetical protein